MNRREGQCAMRGGRYEQMSYEQTRRPVRYERRVSALVRKVPGNTCTPLSRDSPDALPLAPLSDVRSHRVDEVQLDRIRFRVVVCRLHPGRARLLDVVGEHLGADRVGLH